MAEPKHPGTEPETDDCDAPATAEEIAGAERLRESLSHGSAATHVDTTFALSLRAAWIPAGLSRGEVEELWEVRPTTGEIELANVLRSALDSDREPDPVADQGALTARALSAAWTPSELDATVHRGMVLTALAAPSALPSGQRLGPRRRTTALSALMGGLALAASVTFVLSEGTGREGVLARTRTTQPLFAEPFRSGEASARVDRIALARVSDFRDNRFAAWGIR